MKARLLARQGSRYVLTGGAAALVDIGLFMAFRASDIMVVPAALLSFLMATVVNYRLTARHVFATSSSMRGYAKFLAAAGVGLVVNVSLTGLLSAQAAMAPVFAKIVGVGAAFVFNFLLNALLVFRKPPAPISPSPSGRTAR